MHDLLLRKRGIAAPSNHPLRLAVEKHKARLTAEFTRVRLKRGFASLEQFRLDVERGNVRQKVNLQPDQDLAANNRADSPKKWPQPRWVRVNILKTNLENQLRTTFSDYTAVESLDEILENTSLPDTPKIIHTDKHIPDLLALPPGTDLSKTKPYLDGLIILQDKASCFPAYLLNVDPGEHCLDACAAPGNKTTHLAAILHEKNNTTTARRSEIHASERDPQRASVLESMVRKAGASATVRTHRQDFLKFDPDNPPCNNVDAILLDPSCSGSGIVSRDEALSVTLPRIQATAPPQASNKKKRKRSKPEPPAPAAPAEEVEEEPSSDMSPMKSLQERVTALSEFQLRLLLHSFRFPKARKVTYSTCSIYAEENEHVVIQALLRSRSEGLGWRILPRGEQVEGLKAWDIRGDAKACRDKLSVPALDASEIAEACIRCEKGTREGTQGFFVVTFVRDSLANGLSDGEGEEVWEGFEDT